MEKLLFDQNINVGNMKVGTIVKLKVNCLANPIGAIGVCYWDYGTGGGIIFVNGMYDGFSEQEQKDFLTEVGFDENTSNYNFTNVMQLSIDFDKGKFNSSFKINSHENN